jgi:hypothetical protein
MSNEIRRDEPIQFPSCDFSGEGAYVWFLEPIGENRLWTHYHKTRQTGKSWCPHLEEFARKAHGESDDMLGARSYNTTPGWWGAVIKCMREAIRRCPNDAYRTHIEQEIERLSTAFELGVLKSVGE